MYIDTHNKIILFQSDLNRKKLEDDLADHIELINKIKILNFDYEFNQSIDILKNLDIEELYLGNYDHIFMYPTSQFNHPVNNLPPTLKKLYFNSKSCFNQPIDNLPEGLESLYLGSEFNQSIDNLPNSLKFLFISSTSIIKFENLPNSVEEINLGCTAENIGLKYIPEFVKKITLYDNNKNLSDLEKYRDNLEIIIKDSQKLKNLMSIATGM